MNKVISPAVATFLLGGCAALPMPVQVASRAMDGLSVLTTRKSLTDHGLSLVAEQDCAVWRGLTEGEICRNVGNGQELVHAVSPDEPRDGVSAMKPASVLRSPVPHPASPAPAPHVAWSATVLEPAVNPRELDGMYLSVI